MDYIAHLDAMNSIFIISDFNAEPLARYLLNVHDKSLSVETAPFGQVFQSLSDKSTRDGTVVWTLPEKISPTFALAVEFSKIDIDNCLNEVAVFADALLDLSTRSQYVFVASWLMAEDNRGYGMLDWRNGLGLNNLLARMNLHLADLLAEASNIYMLDAAHWSAAKSQSMSPKMWYAAKVPYSNTVYENAAMDITAAIDALAGKSKKLIVVDLDNTLWGGVIGETGWQGIRLGGHDFVGEAFCDFQRNLLALSRRGIQLAIVSKNDEAVALEAIDNHSEMLLRRDDFAGWRINWHDKAENIESLIKELNLGLDSVIFIDDNATERDRVRGAFPQILVPEWPEDPTAYASTLRKLNCFDTPAVSDEDRMRSEMYAAERGRLDTIKSVTSADDWLRQLNIKLTVNNIDQSNLSRVTQLFNKTNQLNLSTRRLSEKEVLEWSSNKNNFLLAVFVSDSFGDMGLVGVIGLKMRGTLGIISDFILSCRAMGRQIEPTMIYLVVNELSRQGVKNIQARYLPTDRNRPTLDIFRSIDFDEQQENLFVFDCEKTFPKPDAIEIDCRRLSWAG